MSAFRGPVHPASNGQDPMQDIMIDLTLKGRPGDDEDEFPGSGSGSGAGGDSGGTVLFTTQKYSDNTITMTHVSTPGMSSTGGTDLTAGGHSSDSGDLPTWVLVVIVTGAVAALLLIAITAVCLVRRKRKAALAQRSARWDRASGAQVEAAHRPGERATKPATIGGYYAPGPSAPTSPLPPPPAGEMSGPSSPPPAYQDPTSPSALLHYDSLRQDYAQPAAGYLQPAGEQNHYDEIGI